MKKTALFAAIAAVMVASPAALADEGSIQDFTIHNETGMEIVELYVEHSDSEEWGDELLGDEALEDGGEAKIDFDGYGEDECSFDIWLKDSEGGKWEVTGIDLCKVSNFVVSKEGSKLVWAADGGDDEEEGDEE